MPEPVVPLPSADEPTETLTGNEEWLSTLDDPNDTTRTSSQQVAAGRHPAHDRQPPEINRW